MKSDRLKGVKWAANVHSYRVLRYATSDPFPSKVRKFLSCPFRNFTLGASAPILTANYVNTSHIKR